MADKITIDRLNVYYAATQVCRNLSARFAAGEISVITGASGSGKSTLLTVLNRMWVENSSARVSGAVKIFLDKRWHDIITPTISDQQLRRKVGMVLQTPNPLPMSISANMRLPLRLVNEHRRNDADERIYTALKRVGLWHEVKERLNDDARSLSGGQQQRLCIARALITGPEVLLFDEPTSALDEDASARIEALLESLRQQCTIILVTHNTAQASRLAQRLFVMEHGELRQNHRHQSALQKCE